MRRKLLRGMAIIAIAPFVLVFCTVFSPLIILYGIVELAAHIFNFAAFGEWES